MGIATKPFFSSSYFAVVGASNHPYKFGNKVLKWYQAHNLDVTPINPKEDTIEGLKVLKDLKSLPHPEQTSISVICPPPISLSIIKEAVALKIPSIWLQPGAEDEAVVRLIKDEGLEDKVTFGGPCILVIGAGLLEKAQAGKL